MTVFIHVFRYLLYINICFRELFEESGLSATLLSQIGILMFEFDGNPQLLEVHVFTVDSYSGVPIETEGLF